MWAFAAILSHDKFKFDFQRTFAQDSILGVEPMTDEKTAKTQRALDLPRLVVELPDGKEIHHSLIIGETTIGRDPKNQISIPDHFISKFHAKIVVSKTSMTLVDLDSPNKTYVNEQPIQQSPVRYGDKIRFATVHCRLEAPESLEKPKAPVATPPREPAPPSPAQPPRAVKPLSKPRPSPGPSPRGAPRSAPPPIEADPMKRLLRLGGLLILVSLALAVMLRVLLVPSDAPSETEVREEPVGRAPGASATAAPADVSPTTTSIAPVSPPATSEPATSEPATSENAEYYFDEGLAHLDTSRLREARESFHNALELDPDHTRARTRLSLLEEEIEKKAERHFDNARQAFQFLRYEEAIAEWEMFLMLAEEKDPRYGEAEVGIEQANAKLR